MNQPDEQDIDAGRPRMEQYTVTHDWKHDGPISSTVIRAVSAVTGRSAHHLPSLYDVIDPDALDALFKPASTMSQRGDGYLSFPMAGTQVMVRADGEIIITLSPDEHGG